MIDEDTVFSLTCDCCGERFYDRYGCNEFRHDDDMLEAASRDGWVFGEDPHGDPRHFCCPKCRVEYELAEGRKEAGDL